MAEKVIDTITNDGNAPDRRYTYVVAGDVGAKYVTQSIDKVKIIAYYDAVGNFLKRTTFEYTFVNSVGEAQVTRDYDAVEV